MNTQKNKIIGLVIILIAVVIAVLNSTKKSSTYTPTYTNTPTPSTQALKTYSISDVNKHNNASSCWSAVNGKVYDLTGWIAKHPGGEEAILSICGKDGSSAFNEQHGGERKPENALASFEIGSLK